MQVHFYLFNKFNAIFWTINVSNKINSTQYFNTITYFKLECFLHFSNGFIDDKPLKS